MSAGFDGPVDVGRVDSSAAWSAGLVAEANGRLETGARAVGLLQEGGVDAAEHQLGSPEHVEAAVDADVAPRQVDEPAATSAVDGPATEIDSTIIGVYDVDVEFAAGVIGVAADEPGRFGPDLEPDVHIAVGVAVGVAEAASRRVVADDDDAHVASVPAAWIGAAPWSAVPVGPILGIKGSPIYGWNP